MLARGIIETTDLHIHGVNKIRDTKPGFFLRGKTQHVGMMDPRSRRVGNDASRITNAWKLDLTNAQRSGWDSYATTHPARKHSGRVVTLNGFQMFSRCNHTRITLGLPLRLAPLPGGLTFEAPLTTFLLAVPGVAVYQFDNSATWTNDTRCTCIVGDTGPASAAVRVAKRTLRILATHAGQVGGYPLPLVDVRPYANLGTGGTLITYVNFTQ